MSSSSAGSEGWGSWISSSVSSVSSSLYDSAEYYLDLSGKQQESMVIKDINRTDAILKYLFIHIRHNFHFYTPADQLHFYRFMRNSDWRKLWDTVTTKERVEYDINQEKFNTVAEICKAIYFSAIKDRKPCLPLIEKAFVQSAKQSPSWGEWFSSVTAATSEASSSSAAASIPPENDINKLKKLYPAISEIIEDQHESLEFIKKKCLDDIVLGEKIIPIKMSYATGLDYYVVISGKFEYNSAVDSEYTFKIQASLLYTPPSAYDSPSIASPAGPAEHIQKSATPSMVTISLCRKTDKNGIYYLKLQSFCPNYNPQAITIEGLQAITYEFLSDLLLKEGNQKSYILLSENAKDIMLTSSKTAYQYGFRQPASEKEECKERTIPCNWSLTYEQALEMKVRGIQLLSPSILGGVLK